LPYITLTVTCPDRRGLVAALAQFLSQQGANIIHAEEHRDTTSNLFYQRMQFDAAKVDSTSSLEKGLKKLAARFKMTWRLSYSETLQRVAIFVSKVDHCLYDLILRQRSRELRCEIPLIISNHETLRPVAEQFKIPFHCVPVDKTTREQSERAQMELLKQHRIDLVILARYMQVLSAKFVRAWPSRIINIHHSFLPAFAGGEPYRQALEHGVKLIGATSHYATANLDEGPIIEQEVARVSHRDQLGDLIARGRDLERLVLARAVRAHLEDRVIVCGKKTIVFS